jgi:hypothetical protein
MSTGIWTKTADELAKLIERWDGAKAAVWEYSASHGQLLIRFFREGNHSQPSLYLLCKDCRSVHFQAYWLNMQVRVDLKSDAGNSGNSGHVVSDGDRLRVLCGAVSATLSDTAVSLRDLPSHHPKAPA